MSTPPPYLTTLLQLLWQQISTILGHHVILELHTSEIEQKGYTVLHIKVLHMNVLHSKCYTVSVTHECYTFNDTNEQGLGVSLMGISLHCPVGARLIPL